VANGDSSDLIAVNQRLSALILATEQREFRKMQLRRKAGGRILDGELDQLRGMVEVATNLVRATSTFGDAMRKAGKDFRDAGRKLTRDERMAAISAFLRTLPPDERSKVLADLQVEASDG